MRTTTPVYARSATIAEQLRDALGATESFMRRVPGTAMMEWTCGQFIDTMIKQAVTGEHVAVPPLAAAQLKELPEDHRRELTFAAQDAALRRLWQQTRIAYDIDPDAWDSIGSAEPTTLIPPQVRQSLPHPNPLLIFPESLLLAHPGQEQRQRVVGVYVSGARPLSAGDHRMMMCSTHHPEASGWTLTFAGLVESEDGKPFMFDSTNQDVMWSRTTLHLDRDGITLADLVAESLQSFNEMTGDLALGDARKDLPLLLARTINMLIYLCADNADLRPLPAARGGRTVPRPGSNAKPGKVVGVGYQVGAQLRAWRQHERQGGGTGTGGTVRPHIRRSHAHTYRHGKGRKLTKTVWLWPIPVNMRGDASETTIVPVKG